MWLFTEIGFYSAVQHREQEDVMIVRCRRKDDLLRLLNLAKRILPRPPKVDTRLIRRGENCDYPYRWEFARADWSRLVEHLAESIDYDNFKNRVSQVRDDRRIDHVMHRVWSAAMDFDFERNPKQLFVG